MQGPGQGIKGPATAEAGTTVEIVVQGPGTEIEVQTSGSPTPTRTTIPESRRMQIPVPNTPGSLLIITTNAAPPASTLVILIVSSFR